VRSWLGGSTRLRAVQQYTGLGVLLTLVRQFKIVLTEILFHVVLISDVLLTKVPLSIDQRFCSELRRQMPPMDSGDSQPDQAR
jgi:hypothetical protein